jgi:hypothetical protein
MATASTTPDRRKGRGRSWMAGILLVIASLLLPTAIVGHWATTQISNGNQFVDSLAPLSANPDVQALIVDKLTTAIDDQLRIDKTTENLVDGLSTSLKLSEPLKKTLNMLSAPLASGIEGLIKDTVTKVVASPAFQKAWSATLTLTHHEIIAILANKPGQAVSVDADGTLSIQLKPLMAEVKAQLVAAHVPFAKAIPEINTSIPVAKIPDLVTARVAYQVGVGIGAWLPWLVAAVFGAAILIAIRRWRMVMIAGIAVFVMTGIVGIGLSVGRVVLSATLNADISQVAGVVYDSVVAYAATVVVGVLVLGVLMALAGALLGLESTAKLRAWFGREFGKARASMDAFGLNTGTFGAGLWRNRVAVRIIIVAIAIVLVGMAQPLNSVSVLATALLVSGLLVGSEILQRPVVAVVKKRASTKK